MNHDGNKPIDTFIASPCVKNCCLDENDICIGCNRSLSEITGWSSASESEKKEILERCHLRAQERFNRYG